MQPTKPADKNLRTRREQLRRDLVRCGLRPREAEARADIALTHLGDFGRPGGLA
jgi:hypothetical protein